jgi:hypothetical protein
LYIHLSSWCGTAREYLRTQLVARTNTVDADNRPTRRLMADTITLFSDDSTVGAASA